MKKMKVLLAALLAVTVIFGATVPAQAAMHTDVNIEVEATTMDGVSVTVPTSLPIIFNADGTNTIPTNWTIENKSQIAEIYLAEIALDAGNSGWKLLSGDEDAKTLPADSKVIQFSAGDGENMSIIYPSEGKMNSYGNLPLGYPFLPIPAGESRVLRFGVNRGAFTESIASAKAFDMIMTFRFN